MARTDDKDLRFVDPFNGCPVKYGFNTNADAALQAAFGHVPLTNLEGIGVFGANRPKPARWSKVSAGGRSESSFVSWEKIDSLLAAEDRYKQVKPAKLGPKAGSTALSTLMAVHVRGSDVNLAWRMAKSQVVRVGQAALTEMKIRAITQETANKAVSGVSKWYGVKTPSGASTTDALGSLSVAYIAHDGKIPAGWSGGDNVLADPRTAV